MYPNSMSTKTTNLEIRQQSFQLSRKDRSNLEIQILMAPKKTLQTVQESTQIPKFWTDF